MQRCSFQPMFMSVLRASNQQTMIAAEATPQPQRLRDC